MKIAIALGIVYVVWGSTYLAIAVADRTLPPLLMLAVRFGLAGGLLYVWSAWRGDVASARMRLEALHVGVTIDDVRANTGFDIQVSDRLTTTKPPSEEELGILRMLDPARQFIG